MKKIFLFLALICFFSLVNALEAEPFAKQDFEQRINYAVSYNRQETKMNLAPHLTPEELQAVESKLTRMDELKVQAIKEYNIFFDAYYDSDLAKVKSQTEKLKKIFDEMNSLMVTIIKFDGIYSEIYFWSLNLEHLIEIGAVDQNADTSDKTINAVKGTTTDNQIVEDCCTTDPKSECCQKKKALECCINDPNSDCCKEKPSPDNLLIPVAVALAIIVFAIVYVVFIKKN